MFADDTNITFAASMLTDLKNGLNSELISLNLWLVSNKLSLNVVENEFMVIGSDQRLHSFSDDQINIEIHAKLITKVKKAKSLGVLIDEHLSHGLIIWVNLARRYLQQLQVPLNV